MADRGLIVPGDPMIEAVIKEAERSRVFHAQLMPLLVNGHVIVIYRNTLQLSDEAVDLYYRWVEYRQKAEGLEARLNASLNVRKNTNRPKH